MIRTRPPRRAASTALVAALAAMLALTGAVAAKDHPNKPDKVHPVKTEQQGGGGNVTASVKVKGNASHPGSVFRVNAVLKAGKDVRPDTIDAVVHFATGDVEVELTRQGGGAAYHANVPVPEAEPEGTVLIDVTALVDGETLEATGSGKILVRGEGDEEATEELEEPEESPEACEPEPSPSPSAEPSESPEASPSESPEPTPSESPEASPSESPEASPSASPEPSPSESAEPSSSPDADETADEGCEEEDDDEADNAQFTAAILARIVAFIESLIA